MEKKDDLALIEQKLFAYKMTLNSSYGVGIPEVIRCKEIEYNVNKLRLEKSLVLNEITREEYNKGISLADTRIKFEINELKEKSKTQSNSFRFVDTNQEVFHSSMVNIFKK
tara:strand:- start:2 stop:334 length:333 start_codon:yes stop_codon:yes gene_type:complete